jgi:hypothetical protein
MMAGRMLLLIEIAAAVKEMMVLGEEIKVICEGPLLGATAARLVMTVPSVAGVLRIERIGATSELVCIVVTGTLGVTVILSVFVVTAVSDVLTVLGIVQSALAAGPDPLVLFKTAGQDFSPKLFKKTEGNKLNASPDAVAMIVWFFVKASQKSVFKLWKSN